MKKVPLAGALVTYKSGHPIGGEKWRDDGDVLVSEIELAGRAPRADDLQRRGTEIPRAALDGRTPRRHVAP